MRNFAFYILSLGIVGCSMYPLKSGLVPSDVKPTAIKIELSNLFVLSVEQTQRFIEIDDIGSLSKIPIKEYKILRSNPSNDSSNALWSYLRLLNSDNNHSYVKRQVYKKLDHIQKVSSQIVVEQNYMYLDGLNKTDTCGSGYVFYFDTYPAMNKREGLFYYNMNERVFSNTVRRVFAGEWLRIDDTLQIVLPKFNKYFYLTGKIIDFNNTRKIELVEISHYNDLHKVSKLDTGYFEVFHKKELLTLNQVLNPGAHKRNTPGTNQTKTNVKRNDSNKISLNFLQVAPGTQIIFGEAHHNYPLIKGSITHFGYQDSILAIDVSSQNWEDELPNKISNIEKSIYYKKNRLENQSEPKTIARLERAIQKQEAKLVYFKVEKKRMKDKHKVKFLYFGVQESDTSNTTSWHVFSRSKTKQLP